MGLWVAEIGEDPVAHVSGNKSAEPRDDLGDNTMVRGDDISQILRVNTSGERRRAHEIAEHHRQLTALDHGNDTLRLKRRIKVATQRGDSREQLAAVSDEGYAKFPEIVGSQLRQYRGIDGVVAKRLIILLHPEAVEPGCDVHARLPVASLAASDHLTEEYGVCARNQSGWSPSEGTLCAAQL